MATVLDNFSQLADIYRVLGGMAANCAALAAYYTATAQAIGTPQQTSDLPTLLAHIAADAQRFQANCQWVTAALADPVKGPQITAALADLGRLPQEFVDHITFITGLTNQVLAANPQTVADVLALGTQITASLVPAVPTISVIPQG